MSDKNTIELTVTGMDCADCALHVENAVRNLPGVEQVQVNFMNGKLKLEYNPSLVRMERIQKAVQSAGYGVEKHAARKESVFVVNGMDCADEARPIEEALKKIDGVYSVKFNLVANKLIVEHSVPLQTIHQTLRRIGFEAVLADQPSRKKNTFWQRQGVFILTLTSGLFVATGLVLSYFHVPETFTIPIYVVAILSGGYRVARKGIQEARHLSLGMNFLMTIAVAGAVIIGEWSEGAMVVFLFSLAQWLEARSMDRARRSIQSLMEITPNIALVKTEQGVQTLPVEEITPGQRIIIKPGERIPLDGRVIEGASYVDQSPITGESAPVKKSAGEEVFAGTINQQGTLEVQVERQFQDTTLARIIHLVEEAQAQKAPTQRFVEKFARFYTPAVVVLAMLLTLVPPLLFGAPFEVWFYRALVLLVIACPCALVISTPVTIVSGLTNAARNGILIKGGAYLEDFEHIRVMAFDKTGTLTLGKPRVEQVIPVNHTTEPELLAIAASIEARSEHPIARAIVEYADSRNIPAEPITAFQALTGKGARAVLNGETYYVGNHRLFEENGWCDEQIHPHLEKFRSRHHTVVIVGNRKQILGVISIADAPRPDAPLAIADLKRAGIRKTVMLTGDNFATAEAIARELGIDEFRAELLPEDKVTVIQELTSRYGRTAMVGDGINDAPALAVAEIGISMGASATDTALETADIALMNDDLRKIAFLKHLSRKTLRIIRENIFIALFLKGIFVMLAIPGLATLWMAVFADMGASLLVVFNGLRVLRSWELK